MESEELLSERKKQILLKSIEDYIQNAVPITSKGVQENYLQGISTATLRNELNALEAMGYLKQLHTSGGRVPTSKAYRFYVNGLMKEMNYKKADLDTIKENFCIKFNNINSIMQNVAKTISRVTNYPTVAVLNDLKRLIVEDIKIIPLIDYSAIMLISTNGGVINNTIQISENTTEEDCINCARLLNERFVKKTIEELMTNVENLVNEHSDKLSAYKEIFESVIDLLKDISAPVQNGKTKLLNLPEYSSVEKAKEIIEFLEDEEKVKSVICTEDELSVSIGKENEDSHLKDCAVIKAPIKIGEETIGSVGVIGPQRLDYALVAGAIKYVVDELQSIYKIENKKEDDKK